MRDQQGPMLLLLATEDATDTVHIGCSTELTSPLGVAEMTQLLIKLTTLVETHSLFPVTHTDVPTIHNFSFR